MWPLLGNKNKPQATNYAPAGVFFSLLFLFFLVNNTDFNIILNCSKLSMCLSIEFIWGIRTVYALYRSNLNICGS